MKAVSSILLLASSASASSGASFVSSSPPRCWVGMTTTATTISAPPPPPSSSYPTVLDAHVNTRRRIEPQELGIWTQSPCRDPDTGHYVPCDAVSGREVRESWTTYAPPHGSPPTYGAIGCPGGGDWCYASSRGVASSLSPVADARKRAAIVAAALSGLGRGTGGARELAGGTIPRLSSSSSSGGVGGGISMMGLMLAASGAAGGRGGSAMGEDVRDSRGSYAPYSHDGRVGAIGVIGSSDAVAAEEKRPARMALPPSFASSTTLVANKASGSSRPKKYGLGSWKK